MRNSSTWGSETNPGISGTSVSPAATGSTANSLVGSETADQVREVPVTEKDP